MNHRTLLKGLLAAGLTSLMVAQGAAAQRFPNKPVTLGALPRWRPV